jgi:hypothetical protein
MEKAARKQLVQWYHLYSLGFNSYGIGLWESGDAYHRTTKGRGEGSPR